eukprot:gene8302-9149_t
MKKVLLGLVLTLLIEEFIAFRVRPVSFFPSTGLRSSTWQEDLDQILDVDTPCDARRTLSRDLFSRLSEISSDVRTAFQEKNIEKVAPKTLSYGKALREIQHFNQQLVSDIIPEFLTKAVPRIVDEGPKVISDLVEKGPSEWIERGQKAITTVKEITQDPSALQTTVDTVSREVKNIVRNNPEGIELPGYTVLKKTEELELRRYDGYSVCSTKLSDDVSAEEAIVTEPLATTFGYQRLASYFLGENAVDGVSTSIAQTAPIILDNKSISFILPKQYTAVTAPIPTSENVELRDVAPMDVAVVEFSGVVTEGEVLRQKAKLEDALLSQNINYDPATFQVIQYNPPYALPWVRRNEIMVKVVVEGLEEPDRRLSEDTNKFFAAPEAGD